VGERWIGRGRKTAETDKLRRQAERELAASETSLPARESDAPRLLHELQVHQIEVELQNEELRISRIELERGLARYTQIFDFAPLAYATLRALDNIAEINHAGARLLGRPRRELSGVSFTSELVSPKYRESVRALFQRVLRTAVAESCEVELIAADRRLIEARLVVNAFSGEQPMVLLALEDISEAKAKQQAIATERALREAGRRKDEFLAALSHELRNPLAPMRNSLGVLTRAEPHSEMARDAHAVLDRQLTQLTSLVDDLLDLTRIAQGKIQLHCELLDLTELVRKTTSDHRAGFEVSGIALEEQCEPGAFWVHADPTRLIQALSNLLSNALKFTRAGGSVRVSVAREGAQVCLRVRDTGLGIAPELITNLFQPFSQAPQTLDRARGGLGLGLAMVKGLLELHGGQARIESEGLERGTEASLWLPLQTAPSSRLAAAAERPPTVSEMVRKRRILVIDDSLDVSNSLRDWLSLSGHEVRVAGDGLAGLELAHSFHPDIVFCDIGLPGKDGYSVARELRAGPPLEDISLIALSAYAHPDDIRRATEAGFDQYLSKPYDLEELDRLVAQIG
jgi:two-component system CheB/CheR fusion protein